MISTTSSPATLAPSDVARIVAHMNEDHADAVLGYARHHGQRAHATRAVLVSVDTVGMELTVDEPTGIHAVRVTFPAPLGDARDAHLTLVRMAQEAKAAAGASPAQSPHGGGAPGAPDAAKLARATEALAFLRENIKTLQLGTVSGVGAPDCSVAPWVPATVGAVGVSAALYIYVSELSAHTANMRGNGRASALLIEDETTAAHLLARRRLTLHCTAEFLGREHLEFSGAMAAFRTRFGAVMTQLERMHDFHLVRLTPQAGRLVAGFGQAYDVDAQDWSRLSHVKDQGHATTPAKA
jgi:heme iron utilization protein